MLKKKFVSDLRMPSRAPKGAPPAADEGGADDDAQEDPMSDDPFADGEEADEGSADEERADLEAISDDDILAEARKRGLSLDAPSRSPPAKGDDGEADEDSYI